MKELDAVFERPDRVIFEDRGEAMLALAFDPHVPGRDAEGLRRVSVGLQLRQVRAAGTLFFIQAEAARFVERATAAHARRRGSTTLVSENHDLKLKIVYEARGLIGLYGHFRPTIFATGTVVFELFPDVEGVEAALRALGEALVS